MVYGRGVYRLPYSAKNVVPPRIFDLTLLKNSFPRINNFEDDELQNEILKKIEELTPNPKEIENLNVAVNEVQKVCDTLICSPGQFSACQVEESRQVGSFRKGVMFRGQRTADVVVVLKTLPFIKTIDVLAARVLDGLKKSTVMQYPYGYKYEVNEEGFDIVVPAGRIKIRIATIASNLSKLDPSSHMPQSILEIHLAAIKHCRWFEENCQNDTIKNVIKILRYLRNSYPGLQPLTPWIIDLLANYVVMNTPKREPLNESAAFRRALQLLSSGLLLRGSSGLPDPCEQNKRLHHSLSPEKQDLLCLTAQGLLRILAHGGASVVLSGKASILTTATMWGGVIVNPLDKAYETPKEKEQSSVEEMDISEESTPPAATN